MLLQNPAALREQIEAQEGREHEDPKRADAEPRTLMETVKKADEERDGYLRLAAWGGMTDAELDHYLAELDARKAAAPERLDVIESRMHRGRGINSEVLEEYLRDLPSILEEFGTRTDERHKAARFRWAYELLDLAVEVRLGGELEISWSLAAELSRHMRESSLQTSRSAIALIGTTPGVVPRCVDQSML